MEKPKDQGIELQKVANAIVERKDWPHGETNRPARMFHIQLEDQVETLGLSQMANMAGRILAGRLQASKSNRLKIGNHLLAINDRLVEFQELYDRTIPRDHEYDPVANPQRTEDGMMLYVDTTRDQLDSLTDKLVDRVLPMRLTEIMPTAHKDAWVVGVNSLRVIFPSVDRIIVSCVMKIERRGETTTVENTEDANKLKGFS